MGAEEIRKAPFVSEHWSEHWTMERQADLIGPMGVSFNFTFKNEAHITESTFPRYGAIRWYITRAADQTCGAPPPTPSHSHIPWFHLVCHYLNKTLMFSQLNMKDTLAKKRIEPVTHCSFSGRKINSQVQVSSSIKGMRKVFSRGIMLEIFLSQKPAGLKMNNRDGENELKKQNIFATQCLVSWSS